MSEEASRDPLANEIRGLADDIFRDKVLRARRLPLDKRMELGPQLFDWACRQALAAIRHSHPDANETEVRRILSKRFAIKRRLDEEGLYVPVEGSP